MNNSNEFEQIIKDKLNTFEYPYDNSAWAKFKNEIPGKSSFLGYAALISVATVLTLGIIWYFNSNDKQIIVCKNKVSKSENYTSTKISNNNETISNNISSTKENKVKVNDDNLLKSENVAILNSVQQNNVVVNSVDNKANNIINKQSKPNATFACDIYEGCKPLKVLFSPSEISDTIIYSWDFGDGSISTEKSPTHIYSKPGNYSVLLIVKYYKSETVVPNLRQNIIKVNETPISEFTSEINGYNVNFTNESVNSLKNKWIFTDTISNEETCSRNYYLNGSYLVKLIAINKLGCSDTVAKSIEIKIKHPIQFPKDFKPYSVGINSKFGPIVLNSQDYYFDFEVFNKTGQSIYQAKGNNVAWDGKNKFTGQISDEDMYFYKLKATDKFGNVDDIKGRFSLWK